MGTEYPTLGEHMKNTQISRDYRGHEPEPNVEYALTAVARKLDINTRQVGVVYLLIDDSDNQTILVCREKGKSVDATFISEGLVLKEPDGVKFHTFWERIPGAYPSLKIPSVSNSPFKFRAGSLVSHYEAQSFRLYNITEIKDHLHNRYGAKTRAAHLIESVVRICNSNRETP